MGGIAGLKALAERPTLYGLGEDDCGGVVLLGGMAVGGIDLLVVVTTAGQVGQLLVGKVFDHGPQARVRAEEVLADVVATFDG